MKFITRIPLVDNDGNAFPETEIQSILRELAYQFGGASSEGPHRGLWVHEGRLYDEPNIKVEIVGESSQAGEARDAVIAIGRHLGQIKMYFELIDDDTVEFLDCQ
ncbi:MAG TPA: hypothetical protein VMM56_08040 [Planctomycetaceae bacterium]|nr:hypothetical protein [Planctomycetaceae bacterium]